MNWSDIAVFLGKVSGVMVIRYIVIAGLAYALYYHWWRARKFASKLQDRWPKREDIRREIGYSLLTTCIFALAALSVFNPVIRPYTQLYRDPLLYGWGYLFLSFFLTLIIHDTYFYWMHRLLHTKPFFRAAHLIHHKSTNPTPLAALAFHPIEALFEAGILYVLVFIMPIHPYVIMIFFIFMFTYNVYGHLGWELFSPRFLNTKIGKLLNTSTAHNAHHAHFHGNYGLYFSWWDHWMGTGRK